MLDCVKLLLQPVQGEWGHLVDQALSIFQRAKLNLINFLCKVINLKSFLSDYIHTKQGRSDECKFERKTIQLENFVERAG